jgi:hypothetical protein
MFKSLNGYKLCVVTISDKKRCDAVDFLKKTFTNETKQKIRKAIVADPDDWAIPYHCGWGMAVRNCLRDGGFGEEYFGIDNLDDIYVGLIEEAVK